MIINKEETEKYYKDYQPCSYSDCKNYIATIKLKYPKICEYLESLGVDPEKPFELIPMDDDLRIDEVLFDELDRNIVILCDLYSSKTLNILKRYLEG